MFLDSRDRLNRKGETARSLEDYRMSMIWWVFFRLRIWCFVPYSLPLIYFKVTSHLQKPKKSIFILFDKTEFKHLTLPFTHSETVWFMEDLAVIIALNHSFLSEIISLSLGTVFGKTVPCVLSTARGLLLLSGTVFPNTDLPAGE